VLWAGAPVVNVPCCCQFASGSSVLKAARARITHGGPARPSLARRCVDFGGWIVPTGILALLPKCPACIAAYFAIGSGIGISVTTAIYVRIALILVSTASLSYFAASRGRRVIAWWPKARKSATVCAISLDAYRLRAGLGRQQLP
jgi:hypothetical protein